MARSAARKILKMDRSKLSKETESAKQIFDVLLQQGFPEKEAWDRAGMVLGDYAKNPSNGKLSKTDYKQQGASAMATKQARAKNGRPFRPSKGEWPQGGGMVEMYGRGLRRWREAQQLTVVEAASRFGIPEANWYKIEAAKHRTTTAKQSEKISRRIKVSTYDLITLGHPAPPDAD